MRTLFFYELKKTLNRKIVGICMLCGVILLVFSVASPLIGDYIVDGERLSSNYEDFQKDVAYQKELDGRVIDEILLAEMQNAYEKVPLNDRKYSLTEEYQTYARPYSAIFNYIRQTTGLSAEGVTNLEANTRTLKEMRLELRELRWEEFYLSEVEKEYWRAAEEKIENPIVFRYAEGYSVLLSMAYTAGILSVFMIAICMAGVFPEEHVRKTDQQILSSRYGRKNVYWAKLCAGTLVSFGLAFVFVLITFVTAFFIYGVEGFDTAFQIIYAGSSCPISVGQAVLIIYGIILCAGIFIGVLVMTLSENLHSSVGTLSIVIGLIVLPMMISVPEEYRLAAQLWSYLPSDIVGVWSCFSPRAVVFFGNVLQGWQVVPILYAGIGVVAAVVTERVFVKYQVSGR